MARKGVSTAKLQEARKDAKELRATVRSLEEEKEKLLDRVASASDARMGSARLKEQSVQLRQKLKRANEDLKKFRKEIDALRTGRDRLQSELEQANEQIYRNRIKRDSERDKTGQGKKDQLALDLSKAESKIDGLERQLDEAKGELRRRERDIERIGQRAASSDTQRDARMVEDNRSLREENEKLRDELSAFDMEFFEEIEDLKYNYQQVSEENNKLRDRIRKLED